VLEIACPPDGIVLDSFAGSGTTGQAVLMENQTKGARRRFILVEMGDYADAITAQRVRTTISGYRATKAHKDRLYAKKLTASNLKKCGTFYEEAAKVRDAASDGTYDKVEGPKMDGSSIVVDGVTNKGHDVPGVDSGFSYYELGPALFDEDGMLNPAVSVEDVRRYVWHTETKTPYVDRASEHPYLLGEVDDTVYYLAYEPDSETVLAPELLRTLPIKRATTVIFADRCLLADETLGRLGIRYRQIPRQIVRM
jgi:adenine-specific DNA-methyltransferase